MRLIDADVAMQNVLDEIRYKESLYTSTECKMTTTLSYKIDDFFLDHLYRTKFMDKWRMRQQNRFRKLFTERIENHKDCVIICPWRSVYNLLYRGFGKTHLILEMARKYNLPIIVRDARQGNTLRETASRSGFNAARIYMPNQCEHGILRPGDTVLMDEPMDVFTCASFARKHNVYVVGFVYNFNTARKPYEFKIM